MSKLMFDGSPLTEIEDLPGSLAQRVHRSLREAILTMTYPPGTILRKGEICDRFGVSRSPVSEAIAKLAGEGLVDVIPQSGSRVTCFSMDDIREATFLREAVELAAVARVAASRTEEQLARLARNVRLQDLLILDNDDRGFYRSDENFHELILEFTGFPGVASVAATVSLQLKRARMLLLPEAGRSAEAVAEHQAILEAIEAQDPEAARDAMAHHLAQLIFRIEPLERQHPEFFRPR
jgi:GntR family transcriptional regulator, rspAB operon transcriptional repressor